MSRWKPDAPGRLQQAAFELYTERGYDQTTVAQIAERAGLTERTFFRHFADKREVLFQGGDLFQAAFVDPVEASPRGATTLDALRAGIEGAGSALPALDVVRRRQALLVANKELRERELVKLAALTDSLGEVLLQRGVPDATARVAAEIGVAMFRVVFALWIADPEGRAWDVHVDEAMGDLDGLTAEHRLTRTA